MLLSTFRPFQMFVGQLLSPQSQLAGDSLLTKEYTDEGFCKVNQLLASKVFTLSLNISYAKKNYIPSEKSFSSSFSTGSRTFSEFNARNIISFQIKVFNGKIDRTAPIMCIIKISAGFRIIKNHQANKYNSLNVEIENMLQRFSSISFLFKHPWPNIQIMYKQIRVLN